MSDFNKMRMGYRGVNDKRESHRNPSSEDEMTYNMQQLTGAKGINRSTNLQLENPGGNKNLIISQDAPLL